ncbi:MAG: RHS repeat-associated core domain-containing protein [Cyclobacteriaceae bacterium]
MADRNLSIQYDRYRDMALSITGPAGTTQFTYGPGSRRVAKSYYEQGQLSSQILYVHGLNDYPMVEKVMNDDGTYAAYRYINGLSGLVAFEKTSLIGYSSQSATMEASQQQEESAYFDELDHTRLYLPLYNHTEGPEAGGILRLSGTERERSGMVHKLAVSKGDTLRMKVYARYEQPRQAQTEQAIVQPTVVQLAMAMGMVVLTEPTGLTALTDNPLLFQSAFSSAGVQEKELPAAYLNYMLFDSTMTLLDAGYRKVSATASQGHEELLLETVAQQDGYLYSYVSNESTLPSDVYFDDMTVATSATPETYFVTTDYQGSVRVVTDETNDLVAHYDYSPWGATMRAGSTDPDILRYRYTGQEYDSETGLYNYRARLYDSETGRFLSVDPKRSLRPQHSPYVAMGNNPIINIDPDGELFIQAIARTFVVNTIASFIKSGVQAINEGDWSRLDPTLQGTTINHSLRITGGLFQTDSDKSILGRIWQFGKRFTWQGITTTLGYQSATITNLVKDLDRIDYFHDSTVIYEQGLGNGAFSLGGFITMDREDRNGNRRNTDYGNALLIHEYGHYLQEQAFGPLTVFSGLNSGLSANDLFEWNTTGDHDQAWFEQDANARSLRYFNRKRDFRNFRVFLGNEIIAEENFRRQFPFQNLSYRFFYYVPFPIGHILYTAFINTGP